MEQGGGDRRGNKSDVPSLEGSKGGVRKRIRKKVAVFFCQ